MTTENTEATSAVQRPPAFCPNLKRAPTSAATTVASALAASQFICIADATADKGEWPMPLTGAEECDLVSRMLTHAASVSPTFGRLDHDMPVLPHEVDRFDKALTNVLAMTFALPVEGGTFPVPMIDRAARSGARLLYHVNDTYAAYLKFIGAVPPAGVDLEVDILPSTLLELAGDSISIDEGEMRLLVASVQTDHYRRVVAYNYHAIERLSNGRIPEAKSAFGIPQSTALLHKLGAAPGGCGY